MNFSFDRLSPLWRSRVILFCYFGATLMLASSIAKIFLPSESVEMVSVQPFNFFRSYPFDRALAIRAKAGGGEAVVPSQPSSVTATLSGLVIKAIYAESDKRGFVILQDGKELVFVANDESIRGYTLKEVEPKRAVFVRGGMNYELKLQEKELAMTVAPASAQGEGKQTKTSVTKDELSVYRDNPNKIWESIGIQPITLDGQFKEFRVVFVKAGSVFAQLGLQRGDVLKSANGIELDGYASAMRIYSEIDTIDQLQLTIIRNNQQRELVYEIR
ncbi:hypothetical protein AGMMS49521_2050 [Campylobacterota bacterium]|nr:hypothetical protein AGMMS49521_2050 [Campylobacterota bacterium]GHV03151.1 hypothetical protein AGMMS50229_01430 [Campylobacterota bacterium]